MEKYRNFAPTGFDTKGLCLPEQQDWYVLPVLQNRDSDCLALSNFRVALQMLHGESDNVQVHRFGHWACGWFEIIIINPQDPDAVKVAEEIESALESYPVLSDDDFSNLEFETASEYWSHMSLKDRIYECNRHNVSILAARHDWIPEEIYPSDLLGC